MAWYRSQSALVPRPRSRYGLDAVARPGNGVEHVCLVRLAGGLVDAARSSAWPGAGEVSGGLRGGTAVALCRGRGWPGRKGPLPRLGVATAGDSSLAGELSARPR